MLISALLLGLGGSFHCIGMCGPIAIMLPVDRSNKLKAIFQSLLYHLGRMITYALMGFLFGFLGKGLSLAGLQQNVSIIMGVIMVLAVVFPTRYLTKYNLFRPAGGYINKIKQALGNNLSKPSNSKLFIIGFLNGFLPCGLVYMALVGSIAMSDPYLGALYMFIFGLGTSPLLTGVILAGNFLSINIRNKINKLIPYIVVLIGILFILRGLALGIPYLSPPTKKLDIKSKPGMHHHKMSIPEHTFDIKFLTLDQIL